MKRAIVMLMVACALASAVAVVEQPTDARAGTYVVHLCGDDPGRASGDASFINSAPDALVTASGCISNPETELDGLAAADRNAAPNSPSGASATWTVQAATGTTITAARVRRWIGKRDNTWSVWLRTGEGATLETCSIVSSLSCSVGAPPDDPDSVTTFSGLSTDGLSWGVTCAADVGDCTNGASQHRAWATVYAASITVDDPLPPTVTALSGDLVGSTAWHDGTQGATVSASDASGVAKLQLLADGTPVASADQPCDFTRMQPCPRDAHVDTSVALDQLADGQHVISASATDAAGQTATSSPTTIAVDTHAPAAPVGLSATSNADGTISARWQDPDQGAASPIVAAHYEFCPVGMGTCAGGGAAASPGITSLEHIRPPAGRSPWDLVVWLQDGAGHADRSTAARVTIDTGESGGGGGDNGGGSGGGRRTRPRRRDPHVRISAVTRHERRVAVRGMTLTEARGPIVIALRRSRHGRALAHRRVTVQRGRYSSQLAIPHGIRRSFYLTVRFEGSRSFRPAVAIKRLKSPKG